MKIRCMVRKFKAQFLLFYILLFIFDVTIDAQILVSQAFTEQPVTNALSLSKSGDAIIAGLLPAHYAYDQHLRKCQDFNEQGIHLVAAMILAITSINQNSQLLPDITLGYEIRDTCYSSLRTSRGVMELLFRLLPFKEGICNQYSCNDEKSPESEISKSHYSPFLGMIGPTTSSYVKATAGFLENFQVIQITPIAIASSISEEKLSNLFSTQPSFQSHLSAIASLINYYKMTRICLIAIEPSGIGYNMEILRSKLQESGVCIAQEFTISGTRIDQLTVETVQKLKLSNSIKVIVLLSPLIQGLKFMKEAEKQNLTDRTWIGAGDWIYSPHLYKIKKEVIGGLLTISTEEFNLTIYNQYYRKYVTGQLHNPHFDDLWLKLYNCTPAQSECIETLEYYTEIDENNSSCKAYQINFNEDKLYLADAIYAMAHALHRTLNCTSEQCNSIETYNHSLYKYNLKQVHFPNAAGNTIKFTGNEVLHQIDIRNLQYNRGCLQFVTVATWDPHQDEIQMTDDDIRWRNGETTSIPQEVYETSCATGERKHSLDGQTCFYVCLKCGPGLVSNGTTSQCFKCSSGFIASENRSDCLPIPPTIVDWRRPTCLAILAFCLLSMLLLVFIVGVYIKYNNTPIVKASNKVMSYLQLFAVTLLFIQGASHLFTITTSLCWFRGFLSSIASPLWSACLLTKTKHIADVFRASSNIRRLNGRSCGLWYKSFIQILFVFSLTAIPMIIWLILAIIDPPHATYDYRYENQVHVHCTTDLNIGLGIIIGYTLILICICTILAWKTRKLPDNFNEARYIFICSFIVLAIVSLAIPGFYGTVGLVKAAFVSIAVISFGLSTLLLLFVPKIYTILFRPDLNTKEAILRSIQEFSFQTDSRVIAKSSPASNHASFSSYNSEVPLRQQQFNSSHDGITNVSYLQVDKTFNESKEVLSFHNQSDHQVTMPASSIQVINVKNDNHITVLPCH